MFICYITDKYTTHCSSEYYAEPLMNTSNIIFCFTIEIFNKQNNKVFNNNGFRSHIVMMNITNKR